MGLEREKRGHLCAGADCWATSLERMHCSAYYEVFIVGGLFIREAIFVLSLIGEWRRFTVGEVWGRREDGNFGWGIFL